MSRQITPEQAQLLAGMVDLAAYVENEIELEVAREELLQMAALVEADEAAMETEEPVALDVDSVVAVEETEEVEDEEIEEEELDEELDLAQTAQAVLSVAEAVESIAITAATIDAATPDDSEGNAAAIEALLDALDEAMYQLELLEAEMDDLDNAWAENEETIELLTDEKDEAAASGNAVAYYDALVAYEQGEEDYAEVADGLDEAFRIAEDTAMEVDEIIEQIIAQVAKLSS